MPQFDNADIPRLMDKMVEDSGAQYIQRQQVQGALDLLSVSRVGIRDEDHPRCLVASGLSLELGGPELGRQPVDCGVDASDDVHSITENGVLSRIASHEKRGREVLRFMPDSHRLIGLSREGNEHPGTRGLWGVNRVSPSRIPISQASVCHSTCAVHDRDFFGLVDKLDLSVITDYQRIHDANHWLADSLLRLGYRTLLFRISQMRGLELEVTRKRLEQVRAANRFAVEVLDANLKDISELVLSLYRDKLIYDRIVVGCRPNNLVHHVMPFQPRVRIAASEYVDIPCRCKSDCSSTFEFFASVNVLPGEKRSWLLVTHPQERCNGKYYGSTVANWVRDFCASSDVGFTRQMKAMANWTNLYCSPGDYNQLCEQDRSAVEKAVAELTCRDPFVRFLEILDRSPRGSDLVKKWRGQ